MCFGGDDADDALKDQQHQEWLRMKEGMRDIQFHQERTLPRLESFLDRLQSDEYRGVVDSRAMGAANADAAAMEQEQMEAQLRASAVDSAGMGRATMAMGLDNAMSLGQTARDQGVIAADLAEDAQNLSNQGSALSGLAGYGSMVNQNSMNMGRIGTSTALQQAKSIAKANQTVGNAIGDAALMVGGTAMGQWQLAGNTETPTDALGAAGKFFRGLRGTGNPGDPFSGQGAYGAGQKTQNWILDNIVSPFYR